MSTRATEKLSGDTNARDPSPHADRRRTAIDYLDFAIPVAGLVRISISATQVGRETVAQRGVDRH